MEEAGVEVQTEGGDIITPFRNSHRGLDAGRSLHATLASVSAPLTSHRKLLCVSNNPA